jgi:hypothetical protein
MFSEMKANLIWYVPLCAAIVFYFVVPDVVSGHHNVALVLHRFSWLIFVSPSAYLFWSCILASVFTTIALLLVIPSFFALESPYYSRRHISTLGVVVGIAAVCFVIQFLIWGSFPLPVDSENYIHIRMIPFLPWPGSPFSG